MSDTGETRLMTREKYKSPKKYYIINLPDSTKNEILNLAMNDSMYLKQILDSDECWIYDGYTYNLRVRCDTTDKSISFSYAKNEMQYRFEGIMDNIWRNPSIKAETYFDLNQYEIDTKKWLVGNSPTPIRRTIKFIPPIIKPDN